MALYASLTARNYVFLLSALQRPGLALGLVTNQNTHKHHQCDRFDHFATVHK